MNECILALSYLPVMFGALLVFIVYNIVLLPVCYIKLWFHKMIMIYTYSKDYRVSRADKFFVFVIFVIVGPFTLALNCITDNYYFIRHLWLKDLIKTKHKTSDQQISNHNLVLVCSYFKAKQEKVIPYKEAAIQIRAQMGLFQTIMGLLQPKTLIRFMVQDGHTVDNTMMEQQSKGIADQHYIDLMH